MAAVLVQAILICFFTVSIQWRSWGILLTRASAAEINQVGLRGNGRKGPRVGVNLLSIKGHAGTVHIESSKNFAD